MSGVWLSPNLLLAKCHNGRDDGLWHCPHGETLFFNSVEIGISNSLFSSAACALFASLGHLAFLEGVDIGVLEYGGFSIVVGTLILS